MALNDPPTNEELNDELNSEAEEVITNGDSNIIEDIAENVNGEYFGNQEYLLAKAIMEDYEKKRAPLYWDSLEGSEQNNDKYILYDAIENCTEKLNEKADLTYVDEELAKKADLTYVDDELAKKSDLTYVDDELAKKADLTYVDDELAKKSDLTYVDDELAKKADQSTVTNLSNTVSSLSTTVGTKADQSAMTNLSNTVSSLSTTVGTKADQSAVTNLSNTVSNLSTTVGTKANQSTVTNLSNTVSSLSTTVGTKAVKKTWSVSVPNTGWSSSKPYTKTITVSGMLSSDTPHAAVSFTSNATIEIENNYFACVDRITAGNNSITLVCTKEIPGGTFTLQLEVVR